MGKKLDPMTWAVVREDTPTIPAYRLWLDCTDCGLFMTEEHANEHARLLRYLQEQMEAAQ